MRTCMDLQTGGERGSRGRSVERGAWIPHDMINVYWTCGYNKKNSSGGEIFRTCPDRPWSPPSLLYNGYRVFPGCKVQPGRDADPSPPSSVEVKNRVELYLSSLKGPSWPMKGWNLPSSLWDTYIKLMIKKFSVMFEIFTVQCRVDKIPPLFPVRNQMTPVTKPSPMWFISDSF